jgi:Mlc titration factor MtfA (ptsG expression regulator)
MFEWFSKQRRLKIMEEPFPSEWEDMIRLNMVHYSMLGDDEQKRLRGLIQIFMTEKSWEGCGGLELTDEIRVTISAQACLLILNLPHNYFENVETILVYPSEMMLPQRKPGFFETVLEPLEPARPISGQAFQQGPVILAWDTALYQGRQSTSGGNVVYHEFAHKLDMQDGAADGTPRLRDRDEYRDWVKTCSREYLRLLHDVEKGKRTFLDEYGATDEAEFFAVATEQFFCQPVQMIKSAPELYRVLKEYYRQDPAIRSNNKLEFHEQEMEGTV